MLGPNIDKLERQGNVDALIEALGNRRQSVRDKAATALGRLGDKRAVEPLVRLVEERDEEWCQREDAWRRFGDEHRSRSGTELTLYGSSLEESASDLPAGKKLRQAADDAFRALEEASHALAPFAERGDLRTIEFLLGYWANPETRPELKGCLTEDVLVAVLDSGAPTARASAAHCLTYCGGDRSLEPLIAALTDAESSVRLAAAEALGSRGDLTVEALGVQLCSVHAEVRGWAADQLGELGDGRAAESLIAALDDGDPKVRTAVAVALGKLGVSSAIEPLIGILKKRDVDAMEAFHALQKTGGPAVEAAFEEGAPKVGDRVRVPEHGEMYAGIGSDRIEMGWGVVGEWTGTVVSVSDEGATVRCDEVEGEVESVAPGTTHEMRLDPRRASELPYDRGHWCFELEG